MCGTAATLRKAERIGFVERSNWDERLAGTNAPGVALEAPEGMRFLIRSRVLTNDEYGRLEALD